MLGPVLDVFRMRQYFNAVTVARGLAAGVFEDAGFLWDARRALLPLPWEDREARGDRAASPSPFPRRVVRPAPALSGRRVAIACTGGSGAMASVVGVARAFEERGLTPAAYSACSGSALFCFPLGTGMPADEVAAFVLGLRPRDYVDLDVRGLAMLPLRAARGFSGLLRGDAVERAYRELLGDLRLAELPIPVYAPVWEVERNRLEYLGPQTHPDLPVARAVRMSISLPLFVQAVPRNGSWWCDGGIVDIFPVRPLLERVHPEAVIGVNGFYPPEFAGEDRTGWQDRSLSILYAASQVRTAQQVELARQNLARLRAASAVRLVDPVPYEKVRGSGFYRQFIDNDEWAGFMRAGRVAGLQALDDLVGDLTPPVRRRSRGPDGPRSGGTGR
ncbi:MAG: patatin-like phospholipase family protein [Nocardioidaceae bacterium]